MAAQLQMPPQFLDWMLLPISGLNDHGALWDSKYRATDRLWSEEPNEFVASIIDEIPVGRLVDIAGGEGRNALAFAQRGWFVENVEISKVALERFEKHARQLGVEEYCSSTLADAREARFQLEPSLILVAYLQIPMAHLEQALDNALAQLKAGALLGVFHARRNLTDGYGGPPSPAVLPTIEQLESWAQKHGLSAKVQERIRSLIVDGQPRQAIDVTIEVQR